MELRRNWSWKEKRKKRRFFVRMKGSPEVVKGKLAADFGEIEFVNIEGMQGEFGFVTALMPEGEYEKKAAAYQSEIISMIRSGKVRIGGWKEGGSYEVCDCS